MLSNLRILLNQGRLKTEAQLLRSQIKEVKQTEKVLRNQLSALKEYPIHCKMHPNVLRSEARTVSEKIHALSVERKRAEQELAFKEEEIVKQMKEKEETYLRLIDSLRNENLALM